MTPNSFSIQSLFKRISPLKFFPIIFPNPPLIIQRKLPIFKNFIGFSVWSYLCFLCLFKWLEIWMYLSLHCACRGEVRLTTVCERGPSRTTGYIQTQVKVSCAFFLLVEFSAVFCQFICFPPKLSFSIFPFLSQIFWSICKFQISFSFPSQM